MEGGSGTVGASLEMGHLARVEGDGGRSRKKTEHFQFEAGHTLFSASTAKYQVFYLLTESTLYQILLLMIKLRRGWLQEPNTERGDKSMKGKSVVVN